MKTLQVPLNEVARIAVRLEPETGCPAQPLIAQWAIESRWGEMPVGHANHFGKKRSARHPKWCTVATHEAFTLAQLEAWSRPRTTKPARVIETQPDGRQRVEIDDEFADFMEAVMRDHEPRYNRRCPGGQGGSAWPNSSLNISLPTPRIGNHRAKLEGLWTR